jgi:hypothetical protein
VNTRKFPRTLQEAFKDAHYGCAVEHYRPSRFHDYALACAIGLVMALALVQWWT